MNIVIVDMTLLNKRIIIIIVITSVSPRVHAVMGLSIFSVFYFYL